MKWIQLIHDTVQCWDFENTEIYHSGAIKQEIP